MKENDILKYNGSSERDPLFDEAVAILNIFKESNNLKTRRSVEVFKTDLQRELRIGYNRAYKIIQQLSDAGYIELPKGLNLKVRKSKEEFNRHEYNPQICKIESSGIDPLFEEVARLIIKKNNASTSNLQRVFAIGYHRACKITEQLEEAGIIGPTIGIKPRDILMDMERLEKHMQEFNNRKQE